MDGTPIDKAYTAAKNGDAAVLFADFKKAAEFFKEAADFFDQVRNQAPENPSSRTLKALSEQYRSRAEYFDSGKAAIDMKRHFISPSSSTNIGTANSSTFTPPTPALASQGRSTSRSNWNDSPTLNSNYTPPQTALSTLEIAPGRPGIVAPMTEAITSLVMRSATTFARTFEQSIAENDPSGNGVYPKDLGNVPSESFYLVKPKKGKSSRDSSAAQRPDAKAQSAHKIPTTGLERTYAIEQAAKAQKAALKSGLSSILHDVAIKEQQINDEHTEETDRLRAENDRLKIQVSKLKSRWEDLKESARKRHSND